MRTLIVGGGGFIGLNLAQALLRAGRETVLFDRAVPPQALTELRAIGPACTVVAGDVRDAAQISAAFTGGIDNVVYGAAITADAVRAAADPEMIGLVRVLRAARDAGVRRVINLSSGSAQRPFRPAAACLTKACCQIRNPCTASPSSPANASPHVWPTCGDLT